MSEAAKRTLRTVLQTAVGLCVLLPTVVDAAGLPDTLPWVAGALAVAAGVTRIMALPAVQALLPGWLRTDTPPNGDTALLSLAGQDTERRDA
ncbi:hypothetical protein OG562_25785 [Streptomyces sp. NBC_01275]|uniref:hypothetical protein n=1 Tax=Streptomyces sp. NBC_01275 TaxID=2903807 RepID=UPI00224F74C4|nr:hypothetical protein [Streptomyces sp. NBC_01275]MCX4764309.1 hypothetical protein [Streptomyces sp. NBC_01275]